MPVSAQPSTLNHTSVPKDNSIRSITTIKNGQSATTNIGITATSHETNVGGQMSSEIAVNILPSTSGGHNQVAMYTMDTDISQLEAPTFTTMDRGPSQAMTDLPWDHKVNLIGKKVCSLVFTLLSSSTEKLLLIFLIQQHFSNF